MALGDLVKSTLGPKVRLSTSLRVEEKEEGGEGGALSFKLTFLSLPLRVFASFFSRE